ncbi:glucoside xylosyltransferase 1-like isoform X2 [Solea solea]|uniref:glucoside xylosyltransferase 1-like isoform X2 n=1 Tax=Solea solea TaxID=90069 RepID=UPI00272BFEE1|nr:glucoside xylosyltransferase 1-like isoform X2 [Solea solea]
MRCYFHAFFLCVVFTFCSLLYVLSKVASSLEEGEEESSVRNRRVPHRSSHDAGHLLRKGPGLLGLRQPENELDRERPDSAVKAHSDERSHLAVVACGPRLEETLTMMKSAVLFSQKPLHFYIFAEDNLHEGFRHSLDSWPSTVQTKFKFTLYSITFPKENANEWKKLFKPCASQRLFLPVCLESSFIYMTIIHIRDDYIFATCPHYFFLLLSFFQLILKEVDSLLYVDTDILFLNPVEDMWALLSQFNSSQLAAMAPEHEEPRIGWYNRFARHPYYGKTGINSGVMLMNMTRLREKLFKNDLTTVALHWEQILMPLLQKYKLNITWGDQDLLNIIFHHNPESLYMFPCQWNYRPDHCMYGSNCQQAEQEGVFILHGNRGVYHNDKQPAFRAVYEAIQKYPFGENMEALLLEPLEESLQAATHTYCGRASHTFTRSLKQSVTSVQQDVTQRRQSGHHIEITP